MLYIVCALSFVVLAGLEYLVCAKAKNPNTEKLLFFLPFLIFIAALVVYGSDSNGFLDMRGFATVVITIYGVLCLVAILGGYFLYHLKHLPQEPESCPYSEQ